MILKYIKSLERILEASERTLLVLLLSVMICMSFLQVILRSFFSTGILWADTLLRHLVLWAGFMGACIAAKENKHFVIDAFRKILPDRIRAYALIVTDVFALVCLFFICGASLKFIKDDFASGSTLFTAGNLAVPAYWLDSIIPAGFILLFAHFALRAVRDFLSADKPTEI